MPIKKFQTFLNKDGLLSLSRDLELEAIEVYNEIYNTEYTLENIPDDVTDYIELYVQVSLFGYGEVSNSQASDLVKDRINEVFPDQDYEGIDATTEQQLTQLEAKYDGQVPQDKLDEFFDNRADVVFAGFATAIFQGVHSLISAIEGRNFVGVITRNDGLVRPTHVPNHLTYWRRGERPDFSKDFNCRCDYFYFRTAKEAEEAGFVLFGSS